MNERLKEPSAVANEVERGNRQGVVSVHGVRYQVTDVARAAAFYTDHLGFRLEVQHLPAFASVSLGDFMLLLSGPGASGSRPMPGGESQQPGGWNRVVLRVADLSAQIDALKNAGVKFRNQMEGGPGGRQIQIEDPTGIQSSSSSQLDRRPIFGVLRESHSAWNCTISTTSAGSPAMACGFGANGWTQTSRPEPKRLVLYSTERRAYQEAALLTQARRA